MATQDLTPVNPELMDTLVKANDVEWIESQCAACG